MLGAIITSFMLSTSPTPDYGSYINHLNENKSTNIWAEDIVKKTNVFEEAVLCADKTALKKRSSWTNTWRLMLSPRRCLKKELRGTPKKWHSEIKNAM